MVITFGDIVAFLALGISIVTMYKSRKYDKLKEDLDTIQKKIAEIQLDKEKKILQDEIKAKIIAEFQNIGTQSKLVIINTGKAIAYNVRIKFPDMKVPFIRTDGMPYETLEPQQSIKLPVLLAASDPRSFTIELIWDDESMKDNVKKMKISI